MRNPRLLLRIALPAAFVTFAEARAAVDVTMDWVAAPGVEWFAGDSLWMGYGLSNVGSDPCPAFVVRFYASPDPVISSSDLELVALPGGPLAPGASLVDAPFVELPWNLPGGNHYIGAIVTAVGDMNPANNSERDIDPIEVRPASDLRVVLLAAPNYSLYPGGGFAVALTVRNSGPGDCDGFRVRFVASRDIVLTADDPVVGIHEYGPLAAGELAGGDGFVPIVMPLDIETDVSYYIGAIVEYAHDPNESNNTARDPHLVFVESRPDLAVLEVDAADGPFAAGQPIGVTVSLRNEGSADCPAYTATVRASEDSVITAEDPVLGSVTAGSVAMGQEDRLFVEVPIPTGLPSGSYTIGVIVEGAGDGIYPNNVGYDDNAVDVTTISDLRVVEFRVTSGDPFFTPGSFISTFNVTANDGPSDATMYAVDFYLSTDVIVTAEDHLVLHSERGPLPVGGDGRHSTGLRVPEDLPPGLWFAGMIVSADGDPDEANNRVVFGEPVRIAPPPDRARVVALRPLGASAFQLRWVAPAGKSYALTRSADLADGFAEVIAEGLVSDGTVDAVLIEGGPATRGFFRLEEE